VSLVATLFKSVAGSLRELLPLRRNYACSFPQGSQQSASQSVPDSLSGRPQPLLCGQRGESPRSGKNQTLQDAEEQSGWRIIQHISDPHHIKQFAILGANTDWPVISAESLTDAD
jgi:hypothetical protein